MGSSCRRPWRPSGCSPVGSWAMFAPLPTQTGTPSLPVRYGLGLYSLGPLIGHNGGVKGYVDEVFYSPSRHATIVVFVNGNDPYNNSGEQADALTVSIADIVLPKG